MADNRYTVKQIADIASVNKMRVYRYVRANNVTPAQQQGQTMLYDENAKNTIIAGIKDDTVTNTPVTDNKAQMADYSAIMTAKDALIDELRDKNNQLASQYDKRIDELKATLDDQRTQITSLTKLLDQQQQLNLNTQKLLTEPTDEQPAKTKKHWWQIK